MRPRYRFDRFTLSPSRRLLLGGNRPVALIPRYFDLLQLLLERRGEALHRREILDEVWSDVVVSDGALNQAVRVLRRALGDDPRKPVYIGTVSRHGYRFIHAGVEELDDGTPFGPEAEATTGEEADRSTDRDEMDRALERLLAPAGDATERREAAELLHTLGTAEALHRLDLRRGHARARALLRDSRWDVPQAGPVPLAGRPGALAAARALIGMRVRRAVRLARSRWLAAVAGGASAGLVAGACGGLVLRFGPGSTATDGVLVALPLIGALLGGLAAAGVGAGLAGAEVSIRSRRGPALVLFGALGGGTVGALAHALGGTMLEELVGRDLSALAGGREGLVLGGAAALGYALATPRREGGMATPRGLVRLGSAALAGVCCAAAAGLLAQSGSFLGAMSLDFMARSFPGSDLGLEPVARLLGEARPGRWTSTVISAWEGLMFGFGLILGLTHRPR